MLERIRFWWPFGLLALGIVLWFGLSARTCAARHQDAAATAQSNQHNTAGAVAAATGGVHDQAAEAQKPALQADAAEVARLRVEVARLRKAAARPPVPDPVPGLPGDQSAGGAPDLAPLVAKQDALIQAQDQQIKGLETQVVNLTAARDAWRTAAQEREQEAASLRIAHSTALSAARAERWKGRIEGIVVGLGAGYVAGRLR